MSQADLSVPFRQRAGSAMKDATNPGRYTFDPAERFLYVANQDGRSIVGYRVARDGRLAPTRLRVSVGSPACIVFSGL